jgi:hypothetical protein
MQDRDPPGEHPPILVGAERDGPNRVRFTLKQIRDAFGTPYPIDFPITIGAQMPPPPRAPETP